ncbi:hypothetical protein ROP_33660 [Rhodococcus opacus B4]|uniref:Fumarylacetoacetase-like C-terminal domain-containing protein n=1 Tax=Rhodococcus opacus (strain B4) TaxID=632772 RepID=C1B7G0_RHOOB|nr:hypothetical protein ROP_33660 [Rhodococcus opacus B4]
MGEVQVRVVNLDGRLQVSTRGGLVDVEAESHGYFSSAPQKIYERWAEFVTWYTGNRDRISPAPGGGIDPGRIGAPTPSPRQVFAVGLNYADHAAESGVERPESPVIFTKFASAITGPVTTVPLPSDTVDWEVELVVVIGRGGRTSQMIFPFRR